MDSHREMRSAFLGGLSGQLISGLIWLAASTVSVWSMPRARMIVLLFESMLIFDPSRISHKLDRVGLAAVIWIRAALATSFLTMTVKMKGDSTCGF
jgi:hypothetical protein